MNRVTIQARRDALTAEQEHMELEYARAEEQIKALQHDLALRQRDLDVRSGAIRELEQLQVEPEAPSERDAHVWQASEYIRSATASVTAARGALSAFQAADPHQHTREIEELLQSANDAALKALAEVEAACDSPASSS